MTFEQFFKSKDVDDLYIANDNGTHYLCDVINTQRQNLGRVIIPHSFVPNGYTMEDKRIHVDEINATLLRCHRDGMTAVFFWGKSYIRSFIP